MEVVDKCWSEWGSTVNQKLNRRSEWSFGLWPPVPMSLVSGHVGTTVATEVGSSWRYVLLPFPLWLLPLPILLLPSGRVVFSTLARTFPRSCCSLSLPSVTSLPFNNVHLWIATKVRLFLPFLHSTRAMGNRTIGSLVLTGCCCEDMSSLR